MQKRIGWGSGAALLAAATLSIWGCDDESNRNTTPVENGAGRGGESQTAAGGSSSSTAGASRTAGGECDTDPIFHACERERCAALPLEDLCDRQPAACPEGPDAITAGECPPEGVARYDSSCGGVIIVNPTDTDSTWWSFDANGQLIGVTRSAADEANFDCGDGAFGRSQTWGEPCSLLGKAEVVCEWDPKGNSGEGGAGGEGGAR